jgi:hypothetical protein
MAVLPKAMIWRRTDTVGAEQCVFDDRRGLAARGSAVADTPLPYSCRYELSTDPSWASVRLDATVEGGGWQRSLRLERAGGQWRASTSEQGDLDMALRAVGLPTAQLPGIEEPDRLDEALDVDLYASPLTNTLPIRRLDLLRREPGWSAAVTAAWILLPSLAVVPLEQTYTALGDGLVRYVSGSFTAELSVDADGFVTHYPGLADSTAIE